MLAYSRPVYQTGEAATHAHEDESEPNPAYWLYAMWPALDTNERPEGVIIQLTKSADFRKNAVAINEALLVAGLRQHELTETAEKLNTQLKAKIAQHEQTEEALHQAKELVDNQAHHLEQLVEERTVALRVRHALFVNMKLYKGGALVHHTQDDESAKELSE
jgi:hypothetical protein